MRLTLNRVNTIYVMKKSPSQDNLPDNISKEAISIWKYIIRKYADDIFTNDRLIQQQWKNALRIFERVCKARNISPYIVSSKLANIANRLRNLASKNT